jgi:serine phosphatase RsbU (regulator of sigma subunit)
MPAAETLKQIDELLSDANRLRTKSPVKSLHLAQKARSLSDNAALPEQQVRSFLSVALSLQALSRFTEALQVLGEAEQFSHTHANENGLSDIYSAFGNVYYYMGDNDHALKYHLVGLQLREKIGDEKKIAFSINSVGVIYATMKNYTQAEEYFYRSMETNTRLKEPLGAKMAMNNLAVLSTSQKKFDRAIKLLCDALPGSEELPNDTIRIELLINLGIAYREKKKYKQAGQQLRTVLALIKGRRNLAEAKAKEAMARLLSRLKKHKEAKKTGKEAFALFKKLGVKESISSAYRLLGEVEKNSGDMDRSVHYLEKHLELAEKIHEEELVKKGKNLALAFQSETLKKENEINYLRNVELKQAYDQINEKNNQLIDSIEYARYFQDMIFAPYRNLFRENLQSFLLSLPKDIVSGDFFWCHTFGKKIMMVLADCTGHGVPGAFVSIVGNSILNSAVHEKNISSPSALLHFLNTRFCEMDSKAGMDLTVVLIDMETSEMEYAGANAGLLVVRKKGGPVNYRGSAQLIGKEAKAEFPSEKITLQKGDTIYLFSDGFHTQKGGEAEKRLLRNTFTGLLTELSKENAGAQEEVLLHHFETWKGSKDQQDDVTVAGICWP